MNKKHLNTICKITMGAGLFGMLYCWRYLYSANMADLVGAGLPFLAGAILFGTGLIGLVINSQKP